MWQERFSKRFPLAERAGAGAEGVDLETHVRKLAQEEVAKRLVVLGAKGHVPAVRQAAASQSDGQVVPVASCAIGDFMHHRSQASAALSAFARSAGETGSVPVISRSARCGQKTLRRV